MADTLFAWSKARYFLRQGRYFWYEYPYRDIGSAIEERPRERLATPLDTHPCRIQKPEMFERLSEHAGAQPQDRCPFGVMVYRLSRRDHREWRFHPQRTAGIGIAIECRIVAA